MMWFHAQKTMGIFSMKTTGRRVPGDPTPEPIITALPPLLLWNSHHQRRWPRKEEIQQLASNKRPKNYSDCPQRCLWPDENLHKEDLTTIEEVKIKLTQCWYHYHTYLSCNITPKKKTSPLRKRRAKKSPQRNVNPPEAKNYSWIMVMLACSP
jgi:hypothetical protein